MEHFGMALEENKTRLIEFGRFAEERCAKKGRKPQTFTFLGFTHYCSHGRNGKIPGKRKTTEEVCKEMQGGSPDNPGHEDTTVSGHHKENEPDTCWLLPLLRYHRQHRQPEKLPATDEKELV